MSDDPRRAIVGAWMPGVEQGLFKPPDFETVTLDRAALAYGHINDGTAQSITSPMTQVIVFPS